MWNVDSSYEKKKSTELLHVYCVDQQRLSNVSNI